MINETTPSNQQQDPLHYNNHQHPNTPRARKLDESEVLIVSPGFVDDYGEELCIGEDDIGIDDSQLNFSQELDTTQMMSEVELLNMSRNHNNHINNRNHNSNNLLDTSHVSVVTVGEEQIKVKDSSNIVNNRNNISSSSNNNINNNSKEIIAGSMSDLSNVSIGRQSESSKYLPVDFNPSVHG
jgi:STE20-like kinase